MAQDSQLLKDPGLSYKKVAVKLVSFADKWTTTH